MEPTKEAAPLGAVFSLSQIIQRRHALSSDPVGSCRILSALAVVLVAAYRQHKVPLFAGTPYASADPYSAFD
jgi:hypothetical protein